ncbi:MAG: tRNA (adenosine(37)-N6)-threonylcarbamoyltransferase complex dimerization subunit type 1 TsaB, partial [Clostridia bacterium]|nr:tRNA (adenosine(37)-N6)-threonylcarbamoyltransferase complex dimerization subunit type 1 TsaB [Clostridia bacterium]
MNILAIDTSGSVCAVSVLQDKKVLVEVYVDNKKTHSQMLAPMIDDCLERADLSLSDIDLFACAIGPGSFTGLRIGVSMIKGFCQALNKKCVGVNTLDALAQNLLGEARIVCPVIDARRGDVYTASYTDNNRVSDYRATQLTDLLDELKGREVVFIGDAALNFKQEIVQAGFKVAHIGIALPRASSVGLVAFAQSGNAVSAYELEP